MIPPKLKSLPPYERLVYRYVARQLSKLKTGQEKFRRDWPGMVIVAYDGQQAKTEFICAWALDKISKIKADKFDKIEASGSPTV